MLEVSSNASDKILFPLALNEVAVLKQGLSSMISVETYLNGEFLHTYKADGLLLATPTGSTAYNLSVGGPLLDPHARAFVLSPVATHSLSVRPLVIPDDCKIDLKIASRNGNYMISIDGRSQVFDDSVVLHIERSMRTIKLVQVDGHSFVRSLKDKLYGFEVDSGKNDIVLGNIDAYVAWSGDAAYAIDVAAGEVEDEDGSIISEDKIRNLSYYIPDEGSNIWFDGFVMPSGSKNYDAVYKFLEFISSSSSVYANMNYTGYTSMIAGDYIFENIVVDWFDESEDLAIGEGIEVDFSYFFGNDNDYTIIVSEESYGRLMAQYPTAEIVNRCAVMSFFDSETLMDINEMWEGVKGETMPVWMLLTIVGIVVFVAVLPLLFYLLFQLFYIKIETK